MGMGTCHITSQSHQSLSPTTHPLTTSPPLPTTATWASSMAMSRQHVTKALRNDVGWAIVPILNNWYEFHNLNVMALLTNNYTMFAGTTTWRGG